jgi:mannitol/fructose-specific phosphotransferase system IIA component (Ntr-type)
VKLQDILQKNHIVIDIKAKDKTDLIGQMGRYLVSCFDLGNADPIVQKILHREADMSTGIGFGVAIPHARIESVSKTHMIAGRCADDIDFNSIDEQPVRLVFMMISPPNTTEHAQVLLLLSKLLREEPTRQKLLAAVNAEDFLNVIIEGENNLVGQ